eukprot:PhM_4_TR11346/c0_g1_i1/m.55690
MSNNKAPHFVVQPTGRLQIATAATEFDDNSTIVFGADATSNNNDNKSNENAPVSATVEKVEKYVDHLIDRHDTLLGLSVRYDTTEDCIMRLNGMLVKDLDLLPPKTRLRIEPGKRWVPMPTNSHNTKVEIAEEHRSAMRSMQMLLGSAGETVSKDECTYYLSSNDWDVVRAMHERKEDLAWERANMTVKKKR